MPVFTSQDFERLDWRLLQNGAINLYFRPDILYADIGWLKDHHYRVHAFDCRDWKTEDRFHDDVSSELRFPDYYGRNSAAFNDCLSDLDFPTDGGIVLVFRNIDSFYRTFPDFMKRVLDDIQRNAWMHSLFGNRLIALLQSDDPRIEFGEIGRVTARWNCHEWLSANRGI